MPRLLANLCFLLDGFAFCYFSLTFFWGGALGQESSVLYSHATSNVDDSSLLQVTGAANVSLREATDATRRSSMRILDNATELNATETRPAVNMSQSELSMDSAELSAKDVVDKRVVALPYSAALLGVSATTEDISEDVALSQFGVELHKSVSRLRRSEAFSTFLVVVALVGFVAAAVYMFSRRRNDMQNPVGSDRKPSNPRGSSHSSSLQTRDACGPGNGQRSSPKPPSARASYSPYSPPSKWIPSPVLSEMLPQQADTSPLYLPRFVGLTEFDVVSRTFEVGTLFHVQFQRVSDWTKEIPLGNEPPPANEYIQLMPQKGPDQILAYCAIGGGPSDWQCHIYAGDTITGYIDIDKRRNFYVLRNFSTQEVVYETPRLTGEASRTIRSDNNTVVADVQNTGENYHLEFRTLDKLDKGAIIMMVLALDRLEQLETHEETLKALRRQQF